MLKLIKLKTCRHYATDTWFSPKTTQKRFQPDPVKLKRRADEKAQKLHRHPPVIIPKFEEHITDTRVNNLNIQMLPKNLYEQIFTNYTQTKVASETINSCQRELEKHGMVTKETQFLEDVALKLPALKGENLEEHFMHIGRDQSQPYFHLAQRLIGNIPQPPKNWVFREGWMRYSEGAVEPVDCPLEEDLVFDVEVCVPHGKSPILATAVSSKAWYSWVSDCLINQNSSVTKTYTYHEQDLIPLESLENLEKPKLIIGHNVSYDRARIREQYRLERTGMRFLDTMSMHICISGMTSYQRAMMKSKKENHAEDDNWKAFSSLNNLSDVHKLYCGGVEIDKDPRNVFVQGSLKDVRDDFQNLMNYCARDVIATHAIFNKLFPLFTERFPHPVTFAGMLELSTAYLPVNQNWNRYVEECDLTYEELEMEGKMLLGKKADEACQLMNGERYKEDIWMWDQDWSTRELKLLKGKGKGKVKDVEEAKEVKLQTVQKEDLEGEQEDPLDRKFKYLEEQTPKSVLLPGYPNWYRKLAVKPGISEEWTPGPHLISTSMQITPKLLNLTWEGYPLHFIRGLGWGLLVPFSADFEGEEKTIPIKSLLQKCPLTTSKHRQDYIPANIRKDVEDNLARREFYSKLKQDKTDGAYKGSGLWCNTILEDCIFFFKLPHKNGASSRVGNPLAKDFLNKFSENVLAGDSEIAERVLDIARKLSYWRNNRDRIKEQLIIWLDGHHGAIIPQIVVSGTLTRRAVEATWMTASTPRADRIGSELRAMVQAPDGYKFVGADVDSQELWIASMIGDAQHAKLHGATPFGWMTLSGTKAHGTDMHSVTAKAVGISRDHAKVINYARIYGAGQNFAEQLLKQFNPSISEKAARSKAVKMFDLTKGKRVYQLRPEFLFDMADMPYSRWQAHQVAKVHGKTLNEMFYKPRWVAGTESAMFNSLEDIASQDSPTTPFLGARLSRALEPLYNPDEKFLPTRVNWVVQSGAVDFLHLMLVCMRWLMGDKVRFALSFHDEVRYLVKDEDRYDAALAMHVTNLFVRSFCAVKVGIYDLPYSVAFFSSVEVDTVLRKESKQDCKTPSNPYGLERGYMIPHGESLSVYEAMKKAKM